MDKNDPRPNGLDLPGGDVSRSLVLAILRHYSSDSYCRAAYELLSSGRDEEYLGLQFPVGEYAGEFKRRYFAYSVMRKHPGLNLNVDRQARALASFMDAEARCEYVNQNLKSLRREKLFGAYTLDSVLFGAQVKIGRILSHEFDQWNTQLDELLKSCDFGPRATFFLKRKEATVYNKFRFPETTVQNAAFSSFIISQSMMWRSESEPLVRLSPGCRIAFVPKDAKTERTIAIEPSMNMYVQKGLGSMIRRRFLKVAGVDLNDQRVNQRLAREGSIYDHLATLDLSAASDSVSWALVNDLLPTSWFAALEQARSKEAVLPSKSIHTFAKFSTMGNGATFELQSLIFWALASSTVELLGLRGESVKVYGDDIVIPVDGYNAVVHVLQLLGFVVNESKSYKAGPFRESCGKHYFHGTDVSPFYVRSPVDHVSRLYWFANKFRDWCCRDSWFLEPWMKKEYDRIVGMVPSRYRFFVPEGVGDIGFESSFDEARPTGFRPDKRAPRRKITGTAFQGYTYMALDPVQRMFSPKNGLDHVIWHHMRERSHIPMSHDIGVPVGEQRFRINRHTLTGTWPSEKFWI